MSRVSVGTKIFLVAASFVLPLAVMIWLMVSGVNGYIHFAQMELKGGEYQAALEGVFEAVLDHQSAALQCGSSEECRSQLHSLAAQVQTRFSTLTAVDAKYGHDLQFTQEGLAKRNRQNLTVGQVERKWQNLAAMSNPSPGDYSGLIQDIRGMITHVGDTSNLILDPDLDSYYLMDVTLLALPQTHERLGKLMEMAGEARDSKHDRALGIETALLEEADLNRALASAATSINEDGNFYGVSPTLRTSLTARLEQYKKALTDAISVMQEVADGHSVDKSQHFSANTKARQATFQLWYAANGELAKLLQARIEDYQAQRSNQLVISFVAIALAAVLSWWLSKTITVPLKDLMRSLGPGATLLGNCASRIAETTTAKESDPEQTEIICEELNAHCDSMRQAVLELARHVEGEARAAAEPAGARA